MKNTTQLVKAELFKSLHHKFLVLANIWDAGSAKAIEKSGAKAIATSSWAVAAANGLEGEEKTPFDLALDNLERIVKAVSLPVTFDFESGFAQNLFDLRDNIIQVINKGAIGINIEDQIIGKEINYIP